MLIGSDVIEWTEDSPSTHGHNKQIWLNADRTRSTNWHNKNMWHKANANRQNQLSMRAASLPTGRTNVRQGISRTTRWRTALLVHLGMTPLSSSAPFLPSHQFPGGSNWEQKCAFQPFCHRLWLECNNIRLPGNIHHRFSWQSQAKEYGLRKNSR